MDYFFENGYAVIIGVGNDLPITVKDARSIADIIIDPNTCGYLEENVKLLVNDKASRKNILDALDWLALQTSKDSDSTAIIYFSGHGGDKPHYHLVPFDYNPNDIDNSTISGDEFTEKLRNVKSKKLLVLLDSCHAGGIAEAKGKSAFSGSPFHNDLLAELGKSSGRVVIASCMKEELSKIRKGDPNSVFTLALLDALNGYGSFEHDGFVRVLDIAMYLSRAVSKLTFDTQHPIIKVNNLEDNYAVAYYAGGNKEPKFSSQLQPNNLDIIQIETYRNMLNNYRNNLLLIDERISEFVMFTDIPIQLIKNKKDIENKIVDLERKLGLKI